MGKWNLSLYQSWSGSNYDYTDIYIKGYFTKENASNNVTIKVGTDTFTTSSDLFEFTGSYSSSITKLFEITGSVSSDAIVDQLLFKD